MVNSATQDSAAVLTVQVECYAGYRGEETPRRLFLGRREVVVREIVDRWLAPDHRYFKLHGDDGAVYLLRHDTGSGQWELTFFSVRSGSNQGSET